MRKKQTQHALVVDSRLIIPFYMLLVTSRFRPLSCLSTFSDKPPSSDSQPSNHSSKLRIYSGILACIPGLSILLINRNVPFVDAAAPPVAVALGLSATLSEMLLAADDNAEEKASDAIDDATD